MRGVHVLPTACGEFIHRLSWQSYQTPCRRFLGQMSTPMVHWSKGAWRQWPGQARGCMRAISGSVKPQWAWRSTTQINKLSIHKCQIQHSTPSFSAFQHLGWHPVLVKLRLVLTGSGNPMEEEAEPVGLILSDKERPCQWDLLNPSEPESEKKPAAPVRRLSLYQYMEAFAMDCCSLEIQYHGGHWVHLCSRVVGLVYLEQKLKRLWERIS